MPTPGLDVLPATIDDLDAYEAAFGQREYFAERCTRQKNDRGVLLIARFDGRPVGDVYLSFDKADEMEVREALPGVPLIFHLEVLPAHRRRGYGTALMTRAERVARDLGHRRVALGVQVANIAARRLYDTLAYREWNRPPIALDHRTGERLPDHEVYTILTKDLPLI
ncbi:hypothetical protein Val02_76010 [Virgisporangium aliadipatigenens]|uniref:N-acetyltransferase domain-containing protein n=1 Tax=Virgisporangium aliadipatigenens TaxID=741659 RepID=A0A8J3YVP5_9ACTN|nr:GNAT family N-acetyltransferase [Virgisporangium aliadipatigenens]GIJ50715.1 hypothetical protein Val02_76010 [Virgisporangium aliadipatigenens]